MDEEELIKKLESIEVPGIEIRSHRRRLRMALLESRYFEEESKVAASSLAKSKMKGGINMLKGLISWRPVWKPALVGVVAIALIVGLALIVSPHLGQSPEVLAAEIAKNSPEVQAALGDGEVKVVKVIKVVDGKGTVICQGEIGRLVTAEVDLKTEVVTEVVTMPELTEEQRAEATEIAKADPKVQELLDEGANIGKVSPMYSFGARTNVETGKTEEFSETLVRIEIELGEKNWAAEVDLTKGEVVRLVEITCGGYYKVPSGWEGEVEYFHIETKDGPVEEPVFHIGTEGIEKGAQ